MILGPGTAHHHAVQFYGSDDVLMQTVAGFLAAGLISGQPAVVIATAPHRAAIVEELGHRLIDVNAARRLGDLVLLDANELLGTFMRNDAPDPGAFHHTMGGLLKQSIAGRTNTTPRAYGEMVDLLWKRGQEDGAIGLEGLWNALAAAYPFSLLCGYSIGNFYRQADSFERICEQHTHVMTEGDILPVRQRRR